MSLQIGHKYTLKINKEVIHCKLYQIYPDLNVLLFTLLSNEHPTHGDIIIDYLDDLKDKQFYSGKHKATIINGIHGTDTCIKSPKKPTPVKKQTKKKTKSPKKARKSPKKTRKPRKAKSPKKSKSPKKKTKSPKKKTKSPKKSKSPRRPENQEKPSLSRLRRKPSLLRANLL